MSVIRVQKNKNYSVMSNRHLKNKNLSLKAKGLLSVMLSLPNDWNYTIGGLVAISKENETTIKTTLNELKQNGYLTVTKLNPNQSKTGRFEYIYDVFENPNQKQEGKKQGIESLGVENLDVDTLSVESLDLYKDTNIPSTNELNTNESSTKEYKETYVSIVDSYTNNQELKEALESFVDMRKKIKGFTIDALKLNLKKLDKLAIDDYTKIEIVNQSVMNSWKSFFELNNKQNKNGLNQLPF
jgi:hypothetical protein